jgi:exonuclease SbcD
VAVYGIPYLDPQLLREPWQLPGRSHEAALAEAMRRVRSDLATRPAGTRSVVLAHAFVAGCAPSDSERDISVGGVSMVSADVFDGVDYAALGHLHGPGVVTDRVRYSGSPLAYSFSEARQRKGTWLVDLAADGQVSAEFVDAPVPRPMAVLRGRLDDLLADPALEPHEGSWLQVTLTDPLRPTQSMARLRRRFPHTLSLHFDPEGASPATSPAARTSGRSDHEVVLDFVGDLRGVPASDAEAALLREAVEACCLDPEGERDTA